MSPRHFLGFRQLSTADIRGILDDALAMKKARKALGLPKGAPDADASLAGHTVALVFEQASTRTRVSFDMAMRQLGGSSLTLNKGDLQLGRGETVADTARVLSRYVDGIMVRTDEHRKLLDMAGASDVPVINGLTDQGHPCQILTDLLTLEEHFGSIEGKIITWIGDFHNMCVSWLEVAEKLPFTLRLAIPEDYQPTPEVFLEAAKNGAKIEFCADPAAAVSGADCVMTDVWVSLSQTDKEERLKAFKPYQVNKKLMKEAAPGAVFLHCLPAHRGEEVTADVIDGPASLVWDEAENRVHAQKAILRWCLKP